MSAPRPEGDGEAERVLCLSFNQDCSCLAVGTQEGFKIFACDPFKKCFEKKTGGMGLVRMLYCTSLLALVGAGCQPCASPRRLQLYNSSDQKGICELNFMDTILNVQLNRKRLVVVLERKLHVFDIATMKVLQAVDTGPNPKGLLGLSMEDDTAYLAYPSSSEAARGDVVVLDAFTLQRLSVARAHSTAVNCLVLSNDGTRLATASTKGTVIRIFAIPEATPLVSLRRGNTPATIHSLAFNPTATLLAASSTKDTVHVFRVDGDPRKGRKTRGPGSLSDNLSNMWETQRDFAHFSVRAEGRARTRTVCAIPAGDDRIMVATEEGYLFQYGLDAVAGGQCRLEREYRLLDLAAAPPSPTDRFNNEAL